MIQTAEEWLELLGNLYYQDFDAILIQAERIAPDFFDLKSGMAGEILQKFSNYRVRLAIFGDFTQYGSKSFQDFVRESNQKGRINFVSTIAEALAALWAQ